MVAVMTLTGAVVVDHFGHEHHDVFPIIGAHLVGMYALVIVVGDLVDWIGRARCLATGLLGMGLSVSGCCGWSVHATAPALSAWDWAGISRSSRPRRCSPTGPGHGSAAACSASTTCCPARPAPAWSSPAGCPHRRGVAPLTIGAVAAGRPPPCGSCWQAIPRGGAHEASHHHRADRPRQRRRPHRALRQPGRPAGPAGHGHRRVDAVVGGGLLPDARRRPAVRAPLRPLATPAGRSPTHRGVPATPAPTWSPTPPACSTPTASRPRMWSASRRAADGATAGARLPDRVRSLVLISTSAALPALAAAAADREFTRFVATAEVDWSDAASVIAYLVGYGACSPAAGARSTPRQPASLPAARSNARDLAAAQNHDLLPRGSAARPPCRRSARPRW